MLQPGSSNTPEPPPLVSGSLLLSLLGLLGVPALAGLSWWLGYWDLDAFLAWKQQVDPSLFFLGLTLLPMLGFPVTPLFVVAGLGFELPTALFGSALSIAANLTLSFWLTRRWLRLPLLKLLRRRGYRPPVRMLSPGEALSFLFLVRITPGPLALKNVLTALAGVRFSLYLAVSWAMTFLFALGFILLGDSIINTNLTEMLIALAIIAGLAAITWWLRNRSKSS